jgi:hypothetical protein
VGGSEESRQKELLVKTVGIPISDGKYTVLFPEKCVYCGAPREKMMREVASAGSGQRTEFVTVDVPYCAQHARQSRRNTRILNMGWVIILLLTCSVMFAVTTSINRNPPTLLLVILALIAAGLAFVGARVLRRLLARSNQSMADMLSSSHLGLKVELVGDEILFSFTNDQTAEEFVRLNGQSVRE